MNESDAGLRRLTEALHSLGIRFLIGGSLASSVHGVPRATMDVDLVVDMAPGQIQSLADALNAEFYADRAALEEAFRAGRPFNLIHYASSLKFDLFPLSGDPFHRAEFGRRVVVRRDLPGFGLLELPVATAEDCILSKLEWYRRGGETSGRQWDDVQGVIRTAQGRLDMDYLRHWSSHVGVQDLLERAFGEAS